MPIVDYCRRQPTTAGPEDPVQEVARRMVADGVGCAVVVDEKRRPVGMVTDRDVALRVLRERRDPAATPIVELMQGPVVTITRNAPVALASRFMAQHGLRRIPVVESRGGELVGVVTADDIVELLASELAGIGAVVRAQLSGDAREGEGA